jgi:hypothetical protein
MPDINSPAKIRKITPPTIQPRRDRSRLVAPLAGDCDPCTEMCPAVCDCIGITL